MPRCQKTYLLDGRCDSPTYGAGETCRWHKVIEEFRADLSGRPRITSQGFMYAAHFGVLGSVYSLWSFSQDWNWLWLPLAVLLLGGAAKFFSDAMIAQDYPFSQFAFWAKMLAIGMMVELLAGAATLTYLAVDPQAFRPIAGLMWQNPWWVKNSPYLLSALLVFEMSSSLRLLITRIFFLRRPRLIDSLRYTTPLIAMTLVASGMQTDSERDAQPPPHDETVVVEPQPEDAQTPAHALDTPQVEDGNETADNAETSWAPGGTALVGAYMMGVIVCFLVSLAVCRRQYHRPMLVLLVPIWLGSPVLGMVAGRYLAIAFQQCNSVVFALLAAPLTGVTCLILTRLAIQFERSQKGRQTPHARPEDLDAFEQQVALFLIFPDDRSRSSRIEQVTYEVLELLARTGVGMIASMEEEGEYFQIVMTSPDADLLFARLGQILHYASLEAGSFAVKKYSGYPPREEQIDL